jgi:Carboxypeptidase regulatory-like domain/TonB dependent receptor
MARFVRQLAVAFACLLLPSSSLHAQAVSTASIAGTVRDASGGVLPGVTVSVTQTDTALTRTAVTGNDGAYLLTGLPVGPYRLEFSLQGFRTYVQTGIVLQVNTNPTVNASLQVGDVAETIQVAGQASLIETRSPGIGMVVEHERVEELPLNGRQTLDLVYLTGMAVSGGTLSGGRSGTVSPGSPGTIAVAGGLPNGTSYMLDGSNHNDPYNSGAMPFPFPEALQEFKVETSALAAQYGYHSAAVVNAVTKSGTNNIHGSAFEFVRDDSMNARDPFAALGPDGKRRSDGLNRNQFGGSWGGPVARDRLFYFGAYQRTRVRRIPTSSFQFVPTAAMLAGDFTAFASPQCQGGRTIPPLRTPFVNNHVDPALYSQASVKLVKLLGVTSDDPCGRVNFDRIDNNDEHLFTGRVDYNAGSSHNIFARLQYQKYDSPTDYDGKTPMSFSTSAFKNRVYSLAVGDTKLLSNTKINTFHATYNRGDFAKAYTPLFDYSDLGIRATPGMPDYMRMSVTGGFSIDPPGALPTLTPTWTYEFADDFTSIRGSHQLGVGVDYIHNKYTSTSQLQAGGNTTFTGQATGLGMADFLLGRAAGFTAGTPTGVHVSNHYVGVYAQDSWRLSPKLTVNAGLRWDPYFPVYGYDGHLTRFDLDRFNNGLHSTVFPNAPAGLVFPGDDAMPGKSLAHNQPWHFGPRLGMVFDPTGSGEQTLRASYGRLYDLPHLQQFSGQAQMAPWGNSTTVTNMPEGWDNPWVAVPGGDPIPAALNGPNKSSVFPLFSNYASWPLDLPPLSVDQWNVSYQRQIAANWMVAANYLGNFIDHVWYSTQINPAIFGPGATTANTNQRRVLFQQNPTEGQYYASVQEVIPDGTSRYNAVMLQVQRRRAGGLSVQGNYTFSHCETDRWNTSPGVDGLSIVVPDHPELDRARCGTSPNHNLSSSIVYQIPDAGAGVVRVITAGWQVSGILSARSGTYYTVNSGTDVALIGQCCGTIGSPFQRANQILDDPFMPNRSYAQWLNPAAFQSAAPGAFGTMPLDAIQAVPRWNIDMALSRSLKLGADRQVQLRLEAFNLLNTVTPGNPSTTLGTTDFGKVTGLAGGTAPRVIQLGAKYQF